MSRRPGTPRTFFFVLEHLARTGPVVRGFVTALDVLARNHFVVTHAGPTIGSLADLQANTSLMSALGRIAVIQIARNRAKQRAAFGQERSFAYCVFLRDTESIGIDDADEPTCAENDYRNIHY